MDERDVYCSELSVFFRRADSEAELARVLKALLTPAELESICQRLAIFDGLSSGTAQREIAENLKVGIATVTRGSRAWQENRRILERFFPREKEVSKV